jgi:hypothetical protein
MGNRLNRTRLSYDAGAPFWALLVALALVCTFVILIGSATAKVLLAHAIAVRTYKPVDATIDRSWIESHSDSDGVNSYAPRVTYHYEVGGKTYSGNSFDYDNAFYGSRSGERRAEHYIASARAGQRVLAYFNPDDPSDSILCLYPSPILWTYLTFLPVIIAGFLLLLRMIISRLTGGPKKSRDIDDWPIGAWARVVRQDQVITIVPKRTGFALVILALLGLPLLLAVPVIATAAATDWEVSPALATLPWYGTAAVVAAWCLVRWLRRDPRLELDFRQSKIRIRRSLALSICVMRMDDALWELQVHELLPTHPGQQRQRYELYAISSHGRRVRIRTFTDAKDSPNIAHRSAEQLRRWTRPCQQVNSPDHDQPTTREQAS